MRLNRQFAYLNLGARIGEALVEVEGSRLNRALAVTGVAVRRQNLGCGVDMFVRATLAKVPCSD